MKRILPNPGRYKCCVCGARLHLGDADEYASFRKITGVHYFNSNWYTLCSDSCDAKFDLTPILYKPISKRRYKEL